MTRQPPRHVAPTRLIDTIEEARVWLQSDRWRYEALEQASRELTPDQFRPLCRRNGVHPDAMYAALRLIAYRISTGIPFEDSRAGWEIAREREKARVI